MGELVGVALSTGALCRSALGIVGYPAADPDRGVCITLEDSEGSAGGCPDMGLRAAPLASIPRFVSDQRAGADGARVVGTERMGSACTVHIPEGPEGLGPSDTGPAAEISGCGGGGVWSVRPEAGRRWTARDIVSRDASVVGLSMVADVGTERDVVLVLFDVAARTVIARLEGVLPSVTCDPDCW